MQLISTLYEGTDSLDPEHHRQKENPTCDYVLNLAEKGVRLGKG